MYSGSAMFRPLLLLLCLSVCAFVRPQDDCKPIRPMQDFDEEKVGLSDQINFKQNRNALLNP